MGIDKDKNMNTGNLFRGLREAKTFERGTFLKEGIYEVRVKRAIFKKTRAKGDAFILEVTVEKSAYEEAKRKAIAALGSTPYSLQELEKTLPNQPGTSASWYQGLSIRTSGSARSRASPRASSDRSPRTPSSWRPSRAS